MVAVFIVAANRIVNPGTALAQRPPTDRHVPELARYFDGVKIAAPIVEQGLAIYPVLVDNVPLLHGSWQTLDEALSRGTLVVSEKQSGSVPTVSVENRSKDAYILLMMGDVIKGGMQTRTVRNDIVLAPGQRIDLDVFCVEAHRWEGSKTFSSGKLKVPQAVQGDIRRVHRRPKSGRACGKTTPRWAPKTSPAVSKWPSRRKEWRRSSTPCGSG